MIEGLRHAFNVVALLIAEVIILAPALLFKPNIDNRLVLEIRHSERLHCVDHAIGIRTHELVIDIVSILLAISCSIARCPNIRSSRTSMERRGHGVPVAFEKVIFRAKIAIDKIGIAVVVSSKAALIGGHLDEICASVAMTIYLTYINGEAEVLIH